ncbi:MAG: helix-turn-helix domain-containing protein [Terrisporobacter sp.]|uniref:helix-turn-helix domain-containing protein n=1 Tax=Terrisporobacter sp. TaxID=1965305 RepID=UPI002FC91332
MDKVLTVVEIQQIMRVCQKTAYEIVRQGYATKAFPVFKRGRVYRIPAEPFLKWLDDGGSFEPY